MPYLNEGVLLPDKFIIELRRVVNDIFVKVIYGEKGERVTWCFSYNSDEQEFILSSIMATLYRKKVL